MTRGRSTYPIVMENFTPSWAERKKEATKNKMGEFVIGIRNDRVNY